MNFNNIRIGDVMYEPSITYCQVIRHEIKDIYLERNGTSLKTIVVTSSDKSQKNVISPPMLMRYLRTEEEAWVVLKMKLGRIKHGNRTI